MGGVPVLFGERHSSQAQVQSNAANLDGQAGLSYWFSPNMKITASYRVDAYFNALKTIKPGSSTFTQNVDQIYNGPMLRLTSTW